MSWRTHSIYGLLEVDVTIPRRIITAHKALTGETLSFTGYITYCLARAVDEDKAVQAYLKGRKQMIMFDDVNVGLMVEGKIGEKRTLMGHVIQGANRKTYQEIHQEIRAVQSRPVPPGRGMPAWFRKVMLLPWPLSKMVRALLTMYMSRNPAVPVAMAGTVSVTAIGMFGKGHSGWGISPTPSSIALVVGSTAWKPAIVDGRIEPREILHLTVMFDHDIVDGGPAARFTQRLVELIESGYGLDELQYVTALDTEPAPEQAAHAGSDIR
jgi:hypothetical protein